MSVLERVQDYVERFNLVPGRERVVVAVSGGADSRCLLDILYRMDMGITVAHLDHGWSAVSRQQAEFVRAVARGYGLRFELGRWEPPDSRSGLEQASRWARYRFLVRVAKDVGASRIATGHTMTDQAETILMHLTRGAGLDGLTGMEPETDLAGWPELNKPQGLYLIRPLLGLRRAETQAYCRFVGLEWIDDPSNRDPTFRRNLIREQVLPVLRRLNPRVEHALYRTARGLVPVRDLLDRLGFNAWDEAVELESEGEIVIRRAEFAAQPEAVQVWLVREAIRRLLGHEERGYGSTRELARAIERPSYRPAQLPGGLKIHDGGRWISVAREQSGAWGKRYPQLVSPDPVGLPVPGTLDLREGWKLRAYQAEQIGAPGDEALDRRDQWRVALDRRRVDPLTVRGVEPGDRIQPLGMEGRQKVSDLFTNEKVPREMRPNWPIVVSSAGEIVWVAGLRLGHPFRLQEEASQAIVLELTARGSRGWD